MNWIAEIFYGLWLGRLLQFCLTVSILTIAERKNTNISFAHSKLIVSLFKMDSSILMVSISSEAFTEPIFLGDIQFTLKLKDNINITKHVNATAPLDKNKEEIGFTGTTQKSKNYLE